MPDTVILDNRVFIVDSPITPEKVTELHYQLHPNENAKLVEDNHERTARIMTVLFFMAIFVVLLFSVLRTFDLFKTKLFRYVCKFIPIDVYYSKFLSFLQKYLPPPEYDTETETIYSSNTDYSNSSRSYYVYKGMELNFSTANLNEILAKRQPYYNNLNPLLQQKFIERLQQFIKDKSFIIYTNEGYKEMPVLLSAAAIQLTFGLENFLLPYFNFLHVKPEEYFANDGSFRVLAGHVVENSITIAFNQMLKGFEDNTDGQNVAIHEMAHALYYQKLVVDLHKEYNFNTMFEKVLSEGEELYAEKDKNVLYSSTAFINLQEFWAESVEIFFEKPEQLKIFNNELFDLISKMLNQNPINSSNPIISIN